MQSDTDKRTGDARTGRSAAVFALAFLCSVALIVSVPFLCCRYFSGTPGKVWVEMILGGGLMLLSIPAHLCGRKHTGLYLIPLFLNSVAGGLFAYCYFRNKSLSPTAEQMVLPLLIAVGYAAILLTVALVMVQNGGRKPFRILYTVLLLANPVCGIVSIVFWIVRGGVLFPMLFFLLVPVLMYGLFFLGVAGPSKSSALGEVFRHISFASYGFALLIGLVVLLILSEGEAAEGLLEGALDSLFDLPAGGNKKSK